MRPVTVRLRIGGERMRMASHRPLRTLKNLLREAGTPYWTRGRLPLLYCGDELAFVPGIGIACDYRAGVGEPGMVLEWAESFVSR
jgi:tRNA(Ile)-lysidine synthase